MAIDAAKITRGLGAEPTTGWHPRIESLFLVVKPPNKRDTEQLTTVPEKARDTFNDSPRSGEL